MNLDEEARSIRTWLIDAAKCDASDLHLVDGYPPIRREHGEMVQLDHEPLNSGEVLRALKSICSEDQFADFQRERNLDFALELEQGEQSRGASAQRFRVNFFYSGDSPGACMRVIPAKIPDAEWTNFPLPLAEKICALRNGLVVFSGVTGSGKTTSMAMMIRQLSDRGLRIITIEDPIEYRFPKSNASVVTQREVGRDVGSFAEGLKYAMRQDPDVILVGEIRDQETARMALSAAETGHLVLTTLHTRDAKGAVTRLIDLFPTQNQNETCSLLSFGLRAVVCQHLLPSYYPGEKRELALEVMFNTNPVAAAIRTARFDSIDNAILSGKRDGMIAFDDSIKRLFKEERISESTALRFISDHERLRR